MIVDLAALYADVRALIPAPGTFFLVNLRVSDRSGTAGAFHAKVEVWLGAPHSERFTGRTADDVRAAVRAYFSQEDLTPASLGSVVLPGAPDMGGPATGILPGASPAGASGERRDDAGISR